MGPLSSSKVRFELHQSRLKSYLVHMERLISGVYFNVRSIPSLKLRCGLQ